MYMQYDPDHCRMRVYKLGTLPRWIASNGCGTYASFDTWAEAFGWAFDIVKILRNPNKAEAGHLFDLMRKTELHP